MQFREQQQAWNTPISDTLTRLLNRKTFDTNFEQLIAVAERPERNSDDRRQVVTTSLFHAGWRCSTSIISSASTTASATFSGTRSCCSLPNARTQLLQGAGTKLFRFGGEEFVVMIRHVREDHVRGVFERFRRSIER